MVDRAVMTDQHGCEITARGAALDVTVRGVVVTTYRPEDASPTSLSPRPHFSPVRTLGGVGLSTLRPADHPWHRPLSLAIAIVGSVNFWGGPTWLSGRGYADLANHGLQRSVGAPLTRSEGEQAVIEHRIEWLGHDARPLLAERRRMVFASPDAATWTMGFSSELTNVGADPVVFGSPATRGREGAPYGGLFWRGADTLRVVEADIRAETAALLVRTAGNETATVAFATARPGSGWFVRTTDYVGLGPAPFAQEEPLLERHATLALAVGFAVADAAASIGRTSAAAHAAADSIPSSPGAARARAVARSA